MANKNRTFLELIEAVRIEMQLDPGLISMDERKRFINDALDDLGDIALFEKSATLNVTDGVVELPDDYVQLISLTRNGRSLLPLPIDTVVTTGSEPVGYIAKYDRLQLYPTPPSEVVINLFYNYRPQHLGVDGDRPDMPNGHDALLVDFAVAKCHRKNGNIGLFREYMGYYENKKALLTQELMRRVNSRVVPTINQEMFITPNTIDIIL